MKNKFLLLVLSLICINYGDINFAAAAEVAGSKRQGSEGKMEADDSDFSKRQKVDESEKIESEFEKLKSDFRDTVNEILEGCKKESAELIYLSFQEIQGVPLIKFMKKTEKLAIRTGNNAIREQAKKFISNVMIDALKTAKAMLNSIDFKKLEDGDFSVINGAFQGTECKVQ